MANNLFKSVLETKKSKWDFHHLIIQKLLGLIKQRLILVYYLKIEAENEHLHRGVKQNNKIHFFYKHYFFIREN